MKIYRSYKKLIITFLVFLSFSSLTSFLLRTLIPKPFILVLGSMTFILIASILFEIQKGKVAKSLAQRLYPNENNSIFIYDNGLLLDFFENFLIVNKQAIVICTFHNLAQKRFNKLFKKESILLVLLYKNIISIKVEEEGKLIINQQNKSYIIKDFKYLTVLKELLLAYGFDNVNDIFARRGAGGAEVL